MAIPIVKEAEINVKRLITGLALSMLLSSGTANADWGDVYYCQMTNFDEITLEGEKKSYKLDKFQFKLDQTKNAMVFGSTGVFAGEVVDLVIGSNFPSQELWVANNKWDIATFKTGKFLFTQNTFEQIRSISADCDKF